MHWLKRDRWKAGIILVGMLLLLILMVWVPISAAGAFEGASGLATLVTGKVQATPTVDSTMAALQKEQLTQQVKQLDNWWLYWLYNGSTAFIAAFATVIVALFGIYQWAGNRKKDLNAQAEERFKSAVTGLGDEKEGPRIGAAILLRTFLRPGYEQFYTQTFDLAVAHLRLPRTPQLSDDPDGISHSLEDPNTPLPLTTLRQALILVFKEAFPLARSQSKGSPQSLDATGIRLDNAYMKGADLKQIWIPQASLRKADLSGADLSGAKLNEAKLNETDLSEAKLNEANLSGIDLSRAYLGGANLSKANLSGAKLREADFSRTKLSITYSSKGKIKLDQLFEVYFSGANLSGADLSGADLSEAKLGATDLRSTDLSGSNLSGADLSGADLSGAYFERANFGGTNLHRVKGLTTEQLKDCKAKGAIDKGPTTSSTMSPSQPPQSNDMQIPSTLHVQESILPSDTGRSATIPSQQSKGVQVQSNTPTSDTGPKGLEK